MASNSCQKMARPMIDGFGRKVSYLRLSVTDRCDLRCNYCMSERMVFLPKSDLLSLEELEQVAIAFIDRGVKKIRITGGEPLVRRDVRTLIERLGTQLGQGLDELTLTTNATRLSEFAPSLVDSGVKRINVSLDTLDGEKFKEITGRDRLNEVINGINTALTCGLKIRINTVALKNHNADEIPDIIAWSHQQGMDCSLIEIMPLGETGYDRFDQFLSLSQVRDELETRWTLTELPRKDVNAGPAQFFRVNETGGRLGFITPLTNNFCASCNRMRVTCTGRIYMCLGQSNFVDLREIMRSGPDAISRLSDALDRALLTKPEKHDFDISEPAMEPALARHMSMTGG